MTRPRGEIRMAMMQSAWAITRERTEGVTWRELCVHAQVGFDVGRRTVENMARAGELQPVGRAIRAGSCRPLNTYRPAVTSQTVSAWVAGSDDATAEIARALDQQLTDASVELTNAINSWASFV